ncbi:DUF4157 domain-containing protein [uncultured Aquimarina sp.]|uniref:eCIS core domain-containing protein n=1 Tax=uncultured Aquimarina sp. TaxID=575652 RepID=UPI00262F3150|nr:DUF4157 domain-containing protein [uncultured Aquimarina sp.]
MKTQIDKTQEQQADTLQRVEEESSKSGEATIADNRPAKAVQRKLRSTMDNTDSNTSPIQRKNNTGLPDKLKSGIENLSGYSMDDVKVHYNSSKPAQLQAHAYAQGTNIHLAPGQEKHLPHEAWHVVQQKQGRVKPTKQLKSKININDDAGLEKEADIMGAKALEGRSNSSFTKRNKEALHLSNSIQRKPEIKPNELNVIGEIHPENEVNNVKGTPYAKKEGYAEEIRHYEELLAADLTRGNYWIENAFMTNEDVQADPRFYLFWDHFIAVKVKIKYTEEKNEDDITETNLSSFLQVLTKSVIASTHKITDNKITNKDFKWVEVEDVNVLGDFESAEAAVIKLDNFLKNIHRSKYLVTKKDLMEYESIKKEFFEVEINEERTKQLNFRKIRSKYMHLAAQQRSKTRGIWKIGDSHVNDIRDIVDEKDLKYNLLSLKQFLPIRKKWYIEYTQKKNNLSKISKENVKDINIDEDI